ncbi:MAG: hypothetical protein IKY43_06005 [Bacteroidales bacterium]|jgi:hypothetical protein|nr:hypothetical protein [Bacteroidales bacterium]
MKRKIGLMAIVIATFTLMVGCSLFKNAGDAGATAAGAACGKAMSTLYKEYKKLGKIDVTSTTTLTAVVQIAAARNLLIDNKNNSAYLTAFGVGLVSGSNNLINNSTASSFINTLLSLTSLTNVTTNTPSTSSTANEAGKSLMPLIRTIAK